MVGKCRRLQRALVDTLGQNLLRTQRLTRVLRMGSTRFDDPVSQHQSIHFLLLVVVVRALAQNSQMQRLWFFHAANIEHSAGASASDISGAWRREDSPLLWEMFA